MKPKILLKTAISATLIFTFIFAATAETEAQTTAFTYQGRFTDSSPNPPSNGVYTMTFRIYDTDGTDPQNPGELIASQSPTLVTVTGGVFTARLNFGTQAFLTNQSRFLEVQVGNTILTPRQQILTAPFSVRAANAASAETLSSNCVGCVTNAQIGSLDAGKITGTLAIANGGTGSSTKNFVDLSTDQTIAGNKIFTGTLSGAGISNLNRVVDISGTVDSSIAANSTNFVFIGGAASVTLTANQRMTTAASAVLSRLMVDDQVINVGVCYRLGLGGTIINFANVNVPVGTTRQIYAVSGSIAAPAAGTYTVGYCVRNLGTTAIDRNGLVSGWVMVTNN